MSIKLSFFFFASSSKGGRYKGQNISLSSPGVKNVSEQNGWNDAFPAENRSEGSFYSFSYIYLF